MSVEMGRRLTDRERGSSGRFVDWIYEQSGASSWAELAARAGVSAPSLSDWHRGKNTPSLVNVLKLIGAAGILDESAPVARSSGEEMLKRVEATLLAARDEQTSVDARQIELLERLELREEELAGRLAAQESLLRELTAEVRELRSRS